ncbi:MAG: hypothetical protein Alpg2KO_32330 [Alphaproteobacteria bacterium]
MTKSAADRIARAKARRKQTTPLPKMTLALLALCLGFGLMYLLLGVAAVMQTDPDRPGTLMNNAGQPVGSDFIAFYVAGAEAGGDAPTDVYDSEARAQAHADLAGYVDGADSEGGIVRTYGFAYPPYVLPALSALASLPYMAALYVWIGAQLVALMAAAWGWFRIGWLPFVLLLHPTVLQNIVAGQNGALTAACLLGGLWALRERKEVLAGCLFALLAFKPHIVILIPLCLLAGRYWKAFGTMAGLGVVLAIVPFIAYGTDAAMQMWFTLWPAQVAETAGYVLQPEFVWHRIFTVYLFALKLGLPAMAAQIVQSIVALGVIAAVMWLWSRKDARFEWRAIALLLAVPLCTPYAFDYDMVGIAILPMLLLGGYILSQRRTPTAREYATFVALWFATFVLWLIPLTSGLPPVAPLVLLAGLGWVIHRHRQDADMADRTITQETGQDKTEAGS